MEKILAMCFGYRGDPEWVALLEKYSTKEILCGVCMIRPEESLYTRIVNLIEEMNMRQ